jgi:hypothetical protein
MKNTAASITFFAFFALIILSLPNLTRPEIPEAGEGEEEQQRREAYFENQHRAAPDVNWREVEAQNMLKQYEISLRNRQNASNRGGVTPFAGGLLNGTWYERGSTNNAGSMVAVDYDPTNDRVYSISAGGSLWRGNLTGTNWIPLNNGLSFANNVLKVLPRNGGRRILAGLNQKIYYSDDEGVSFTPSAGITYPVSWGSNGVKDIVVLNDANKTIYALIKAWNQDPWVARLYLYRSVDNGISFTKIHTFSHNDNKGTSLYVPYNSAICYIMDSNNTDNNSVNSTALYTLNGGTTLNTLSTSTGLISEDYIQLTGANLGSSTTFYALIDKNKIYRSNDAIAWTLQSSLTVNTWNVGLVVSLTDPNVLQYGNVDCYRSVNGGSSWSPINYWYDYYDQTHSKLHADMMAMKYFKKADGTEFAINNNHGGMYISYDKMATVTNISVANLNVSQYYDVRTCPWDVNLCHVGTQDQGEQSSIAANTTSATPFVQVVSGDNGQMVYTKSSTQTYLWSEYPGGVMQLHFAPYRTTYGGNYSTWSMSGSYKPNTNWMLATAPTANSSTTHEILIGGGEVNGGNGSYLIKLSYDSNNGFTPYQYDYNFQANANDPSKGISAIATTVADVNRYYVALEDGSFFYSTNQGTTWTKSQSFTGPTSFYLYGNAILTSKTNANLVYYGGSGYSNSGFYRSTNGGISFTALTNGLPATLISDLAFSADEKFVFAATDAGPYVYSVVNNQWYSLQDAQGTPAYVKYTSVEFVTSANTVRFATYGRGIWDLVFMTIVPVELTDFKVKAVKNSKISLDWSVASAINFDKYIVERSPDGKAFTVLSELKSRTTQKATYTFQDENPLIGTNYYRLKMVDTDGKTTYSKIESAVIVANKNWKVYPNSLSKSTPLSIELPLGTEKATLRLFDLSGRLVKETALGNRTEVSVADLYGGVYLYQIVAGRDKSSGKIFVF